MQILFIFDFPWWPPKIPHPGHRLWRKTCRSEPIPPPSSQDTRSFTGKLIYFSRTYSKPLNLNGEKRSINSSPKPISWSSMIYFCARKFRNPAKRGTDDLLDIILNRYSSRKSTLITSNRPIEDWGKLLRDNAASSAILDRLLHRGHLLNFKGKSYRLKEAASRLSEIRRKKQDEKGNSMDLSSQQ